MMKIDRDIINVKKDIKKLSEMKFKARNITTLEELDSLEKQNRREEIIHAISTYIAAEKNGMGNIGEIAGAIRLSRQTFAKYLKHYTEYGELPTHGNTGNSPWNKMDDSKVLKVITITNKIVHKVEKFANEPVPTLVTLLYEKVREELVRKYGNMQMSLSTFKRIVNNKIIDLEVKYETKIKRKVKKRLLKLTTKLEELQLLKNRRNVEMKQTATQKQILSSKPETEKIRTYEVSKRRGEAEPGFIVQWDGSLDQFKNNQRVTRMQAIDHNTLATMGLSFTKNENNNGFQMLISQIINNYGIPTMILGDKRKGVDPRDAGALNAIVCKLLGIALNLDSNSIHKSELESLNGKMHPWVTYHCALNNIDTITKLNQNSRQMVEQSNKYFKRKNVDGKNMRQASEEVKEILRGKISQVFITSQEGIIVKSNGYRAFRNNKPMSLDRGTWAIVSYDKGDPNKIWTDMGIFELRTVDRKFEIRLLETDKLSQLTDKHFVDNGVMIINKETFHFLSNHFIDVGRKRAIREKDWALDKQILEKIERKRRI